MTQENIAKLYSHFCKLAEGNFSEDDFSGYVGSKKDGGKISMGEMTPERRNLIISDAIANKEILEKKFKISSKIQSDDKAKK